MPKRPVAIFRGGPLNGQMRPLENAPLELTFPVPPEIWLGREGREYLKPAHDVVYQREPESGPGPIVYRYRRRQGREP